MIRPPRVKICGITRWEDADLAVSLGAHALGFIFWERSPRHIAPDLATTIGRLLPAFVTRVGVFVNMPPADVALVVARTGLDAVQLQGDEDVNDYRGVGARLIRAVSLEDDASVDAAAKLPADVTVLVDAADRERRGGTGRLADWLRAADLATRRPIVLAGGLRPDNVVEAARIVQPWGIDVSSGVEAAPGRKDHARLRLFFEALPNCIERTT